MRSRSARSVLWFFVSVLIWSWTAPAHAHPAIGVVADSRGNVYFTDLAQVWKIAPDGRVTVAVPRVHTHELYLDAEDNLFGEHLWYEGDRTKKWGHRVWRLSADGALADLIPAKEGFLSDYSFVRDGLGNMYWAGDGAGDGSTRVSIRKRAPDGTVVTLAGPSAGFKDIRWIAATPDGTVYAIDLGSIRRITPDGRVTTLAKDIDDASRLNPLDWSRKHRLMGLWPRADGSVLVANPTGMQVKRIASDGTVSVVARSEKPWSPTGVGQAPGGDLLVLESNGTRARVRRIRPDGIERVFEP